MSDKETYIDGCTECGNEVESSEDRYTCPDCGYNGPNCGKCYDSSHGHMECDSEHSLCTINGWAGV